MPLVINTNSASLNAQGNLAKTKLALGNALQRLSSGLRVNSAKDDAAGMAIATRMEAQSRGISVAVRNLNDGISALQVADGALSKATNMLQRMRELMIQGMNGTLSDSDKEAIRVELQSMMDGITGIFNQTDFNGSKLLAHRGITGSTLNTWKATLQIGANTGDVLTIRAFDAQLDEYGDPIDYPNLLTASVTNTGDMVGSTIGFEWATVFLPNVDQSIDAIIKARAGIGAQLNRLDGVISNLQVANESISAARSRIIDADFATETAALTKAQILQSASLATLAQANASPNSLLRLLGD